MFLANAFSLAMLAEVPASLQVRELSRDEASSLAANAVSCVGHADTANLFAAELGVPVACNRVSVSLKKGDRVLVGQYQGPRLPEGATALPAGASVRWLLVEI